MVREALELARGELEQRERPRRGGDCTSRLQGYVQVDAGFLRELVVNLLLAARDRMARGRQAAHRLAARTSTG